jgi:hypothetical protein
MSSRRTSAIEKEAVRERERERETAIENNLPIAVVSLPVLPAVTKSSAKSVSPAEAKMASSVKAVEPPKAESPIPEAAVEPDLSITEDVEESVEIPEPPVIKERTSKLRNSVSVSSSDESYFPPVVRKSKGEVVVAKQRNRSGGSVSGSPTENITLPTTTRGDPMCSKKMTREERKIESYLKLIERMENNEKKKQSRINQKKDKDKKPDEKDEVEPTVVTPRLTPVKFPTVKRRGKRRGRSGSTHHNQKPNKPQLISQRNSGSGGDIRSTSTESDINSADEDRRLGMSPIRDGSGSSFRFPKTKTLFLTEWMQETVNKVAPVPVPTEPTVPHQYYRKAASTPQPPSASAVNAHAPPTTPQHPPSVNMSNLHASNMDSGSAKKRWLRQAISEETDLINVNHLSPTAMQNNSGPNSPPPTDYVAPLKKRRLARASMSSEISNTPPSTPNNLQQSEMEHDHLDGETEASLDAEMLQPVPEPEMQLPEPPPPPPAVIENSGNDNYYNDISSAEEEDDHPEYSEVEENTSYENETTVVESQAPPPPPVQDVVDEEPEVDIIEKPTVESYERKIEESNHPLEEVDIRSVLEAQAKRKSLCIERKQKSRPEKVEIARVSPEEKAPAAAAILDFVQKHPSVDLNFSRETINQLKSKVVTEQGFIENGENCRPVEVLNEVSLECHHPARPVTICPPPVSTTPPPPPPPAIVSTPNDQSSTTTTGAKLVTPTTPLPPPPPSDAVDVAQCQNVNNVMSTGNVSSPALENSTPAKRKLSISEYYRRQKTEGKPTTVEKEPNFSINTPQSALNISTNSDCSFESISPSPIKEIPVVNTKMPEESSETNKELVSHSPWSSSPTLAERNQEKVRERLSAFSGTTSKKLRNREDSMPAPNNFVETPVPTAPKYMSTPTYLESPRDKSNVPSAKYIPMSNYMESPREKHIPSVTKYNTQTTPTYMESPRDKSKYITTPTYMESPRDKMEKSKSNGDVNYNWSSGGSTPNQGMGRLSVPTPGALKQSGMPPLPNHLSSGSHGVHMHGNMLNGPGKGGPPGPPQNGYSTPSGSSGNYHHLYRNPGSSPAVYPPQQSRMGGGGSNSSNSSQSNSSRLIVGGVPVGNLLPLPPPPPPPSNQPGPAFGHRFYNKDFYPQS